MRRYVVMRVSNRASKKEFLGRRISRHEIKTAEFEAKNDTSAKRRFKECFPDGDGYVRFKLYCFLDVSAGPPYRKG